MEQEFLDALSGSGIPATHALRFDGGLHRYHVYGDKKGRKNGWYRFVKIRDDFAFASYGCNKRGLSATWTNKQKSERTKYDEKTIKKKRADIEKAAEALHVKIAIKAQNMWGWLKTPERHDYSDRKKIRLYGVKQLNKALVVPVYVGNSIATLQKIYADGFKGFLADGKAEGGYYWIGPETDVIYLCEGYATAASIHEATGKQVVMAFFAANLLPVAKFLRERNPEKKIIIAADNDQWTDKPIRNPGMSYAQEAADKYGMTVIFPRFSPEDKEHLTDWNDWHVRWGLQSLHDEILQIKKPVPVVIDTSQIWRLQLREGKETLPGFIPFDSKSKDNAFLFMENHDHFKGLLAYNIFTDTKMLVRCPPWEVEAEFIPREINDTDAAMYVRYLEKLGIRTGKDVIADYINKIAKQNTVNPPRDYFDRLIWDGTPRIEGWLSYYLGCERQTRDYLALIGSKWLMGAVSRVYNPGCKFDNVLVLEGKQGIKKTSALRTLATFNHETYFLEFPGDVSNKDSLMLMQGKIIIEMSELASINRSAIEEIKAFITRQVDEYRPPYGRSPIKRPRYFVLGASTNNDEADEYLLDSSGGRRFWPAACGEVIDLESLERDKSQLWAEAVYRYKAGGETWISDEYIEIVLEEQRIRQAQDVLMPRVEQALYRIQESSGEITTDNILNKMDYPVQALKSAVKRSVITCMKELGYKLTKASRFDRRNVWKK